MCVCVCGPPPPTSSNVSFKRVHTQKNTRRRRVSAPQRRGVAQADPLQRPLRTTGLVKPFVVQLSPVHSMEPNFSSGLANPLASKSADESSESRVDNGEKGVVSEDHSRHSAQSGESGGGSGGSGGSGVNSWGTGVSTTQSLPLGATAHWAY